MNENYIVINGKKLELTADQLQQLGVKVNKENPYSSDNAITSYMIEDGTIDFRTSSAIFVQGLKQSFASFETLELAEQTYLRELIERKLRAYAYDNNTESIDWRRCNQEKWIVCNNCGDKKSWSTESFYNSNYGGAYFTSETIAKNAIKEVVKPFMEEHPNFKWGE